jgi:tetratricopeptide (TPR) repeat protein
MTMRTGWKFKSIVLEKETLFVYLTDKDGTTMRKYYFLILAGLLLSSEGCQVYNECAGFVSQRYVNTVAYFNTYYNAQTDFNDAEKEVIAARSQELGKPVSQTTEPPLSQAAKDKFNLAIEKASKLLTFYPTSKWVDNALLMIGKSYFYLGDDLKSQRKFLEMFAKFPQSDYRFEAELWYGRSLLRQKRYDEGVQSLERLYADAVDKNEKQIAGLASLSIGRHFYRTLDYEQAITNYQRSIEISNDGSVNAETQLQIGFSYIAIGDTQKAASAFTRVENFDPEYETSFAAKFENIKILTATQQYDEALRRLESFLNNAKNLENFPRIQLEIGRVYLAQGKVAEAIAKFSFVDTSYAKTDAAARAYFYLGRLYEWTQIDYAKAGLNYTKAKLEFPASLITADAAKKGDAFVKYFILYSDMARFDSLIGMVKIARAKRDSAALAADTLHATDSSMAISQSGKNPGLPKEIVGKLQARMDSLARVDSIKGEINARLFASETHAIDTLRRAIVRSHFELAGVFYLELERQDSALFWYQRVINEGGETEYAPRALFTLAEIFKASGSVGKGNADSLYAEVISRYPESPYAQESRRSLGIPLLVARKDTAEELYLRAETFFDGPSADSALPILYGIVRNNRSSPYCPKALYTIGWLYENKLNKEDSASAVYRRLIAVYPSSQFAIAVKPKVQEEDFEKREAQRKADEELAAKKRKEAADKKAAEDAKAKPPAIEP